MNVITYATLTYFVIFTVWEVLLFESKDKANKLASKKNFAVLVTGIDFCILGLAFGTIGLMI